MMLSGFTLLPSLSLGLHKGWQKVLHFIYPSLCPFCRESVEKDGVICHACWPKMSFITKPFCQKCALPLELAFQEETICGQCLLEPPVFSDSRAVFSYAPLVKRLILRFKNNQATALASFMGDQMYEKSKDLIQTSDFIVPVPLHKKRLQKRGFNQATLLAWRVAKDDISKVKTQLLVRKTNTPSQGSLSAKNRKKNVENAFGIHPFFQKKQLSGKVVTLIDDVMTTGATLSSCAKVLKKEGARVVNVVVFSRTVR